MKTPNDRTSPSLWPLLKRFADRVKHRPKKTVSPADLKALSILWKQFMYAKTITSRQWADDTAAAESVLHAASRNGYLQLCVQQGFLSGTAYPFVSPVGTAYRSTYPVVPDPKGGKRIFIPAPIETNRRRH